MLFVYVYSILKAFNANRTRGIPVFSSTDTFSNVCYILVFSFISGRKEQLSVIAATLGVISPSPFRVLVGILVHEAFLTRYVALGNLPQAL